MKVNVLYELSQESKNLLESVRHLFNTNEIEFNVEPDTASATQTFINYKRKQFMYAHIC